MGSLRWWSLSLAAAVALAACGGAPRPAPGPGPDPGSESAAEPPLLLADPDDCHCSLTDEARAAGPADEPAAAAASDPEAMPPSLPDAATVAGRYAGGSAARPAPPAWSGRRIDLDLIDADLHNVFRLLSEAAGLDIVVSDEVRGTITLRLDDVPWDQALDVVVRSEGLSVTRSGRVLVIRRPVTP